MSPIALASTRKDMQTLSILACRRRPRDAVPSADSDVEMRAHAYAKHPSSRAWMSTFMRQSAILQDNVPEPSGTRCAARQRPAKRRVQWDSDLRPIEHAEEDRLRRSPPWLAREAHEPGPAGRQSRRQRMADSSRAIHCRTLGWYLM